MQKAELRLFDSHTAVYYWNKNSKKRFIVNQGGTSSSKTYSIMQVLCAKALFEPLEQKLITVVALTQNALERGALKDFKTLLGKSEVLRSCIEDPNLKRGPYVFKNGVTLEFVNLNDPAKARHGKRDYLFLNEANTINYEASSQLIVRTEGQVFFDFNSDNEFWVHREYPNSETCDFFISNFTHNEYVSDIIRQSILNYRTRWYSSGDERLFNIWRESMNNKDFEAWNKTSSAYFRNKFYVYGLGMTGIVEGVIFDSIEWIKFLPLGMTKVAYALDFGFSHDPSAMSKVGMKNGQVYAKELIYETGLTTPDLIKRFEEMNISKKDLIIADSANQDAIAQIERAGYNIVKAHKPPGSIKAGLDGLLSLNISITRSSKNWKDEQDRYKWLKKNGEWKNEPIDAHNHLWDGLRYWYAHFFPFGGKAKKGRNFKRKIIRT